MVIQQEVFKKLLLFAAAEARKVFSAYVSGGQRGWKMKKFIFVFMAFVFGSFLFFYAPQVQAYTFRVLSDHQQWKYANRLTAVCRCEFRLWAFGSSVVYVP
jgi:hypothetical protein